MIRSDRHGSALVITIDRPERRNALNAALCETIAEAIQHKGDARAVVILGSGGSFCAGADLVQRTADATVVSHGGMDAGGNDTFRPAFDSLCDHIAACPVPVIAGVDGPALGAGMQLAIACDLRVSTARANFGIPSGKLGVMLSPRNVMRMRQVMGASMARAVLTGGELVSGERAWQLGFVHRLVEDADAAALGWANEIGQLAPLSMQGHKAVLGIADRAVLNAEEEHTMKSIEHRAFTSEDLQEGLAAFAEKRSPNFRGQ